MTDLPAPWTIDGFRSETAVVNGTRIHYWLGGNPGGQPVLLRYGFLGGAARTVTMHGRWLRSFAPWLGRSSSAVANAPHQFHNGSGKPARLLCICSPAGQEDFFKEVGVPVATRTTPPPKLDKEQQQQFMDKAKALAPKYKTELLKEA